MNPGDQPSAELRLLLEALLDDRLSESQQARLQKLLIGDPEARRAYVQYMATIAGVRRYLKGRPAFLEGVHDPMATSSQSGDEGGIVEKEAGVSKSIPPAAPLAGESPFADAGESPAPNVPPLPPVLGFIGDCFRLGIDFMARPAGMVFMVVACSLAALFFMAAPTPEKPGRAIDGQSHNLASGKEANGKSSNDNITADIVEPVFIARVTDSHNAQWHAGDALPAGSSLLALGQKLKLLTGLVEITFDNGAKVLLEGPAEFALDSHTQATLSFGQLTAHVPDEAVGFTIQTPMVNVVDLGTEFGVRVSQKGMTDVAVFSGQVIAAPLDAAPGSGQSTPVLADEVRRFWTGSALEEEPLAAPDFRRSIPKPLPVENPSFELPRIGGWLAREVSGWTIVSQPAWEGHLNGGVQLAAAERVQLPTPPNGQQWGFLESRKAADGGVHRTSMHQAVAPLAPNTEYRLRLTVGREGFRPVWGIKRGYAFSSFPGVEVGLWSGPDKQSEPTEPLKTVRDPAPLLRAAGTETVTLNYRSPATLPPGEQWLFIRLAVGADDWCRVLFDDVQLEALPMSEMQTSKKAN